MKINQNLMLDIISFIRKYQQEEGKSPSYRAIMKECRISSLSVVQRYVQRLSEAGDIETESGGSIAMDWRLSQSGTIGVPLIGSVYCGQPELAFEDYEGIYRLPKDITGEGEFFMLIAKGDSMKNANIFEDDYLVIRRQETADSGDIVVACRESECDISEEATLKRYIVRNGKPILHPENEAYKDIDAKNCRIIGKLTTIIRNV